VFLNLFLLLSGYIIIDVAFKHFNFELDLGFIGALLGGLISGGLTLVGVTLGLKNEKDNSLRYRFYENVDEIRNIIEWTKSTDYILNHVSRNPKKELIKELNKKQMELEKLLKSIMKIDMDWMNKCEEFKYDLIGIKISLNHEEDWPLLIDEVKNAKESLKKIKERYYEITKL